MSSLTAGYPVKLLPRTRVFFLNRDFLFSFTKNKIPFTRAVMEKISLSACKCKKLSQSSV